MSSCRRLPFWTLETQGFRMRKLSSGSLDYHWSGGEWSHADVYASFPRLMYYFYWGQSVTWSSWFLCKRCILKDGTPPFHWVASELVLQPCLHMAILGLFEVSSFPQGWANHWSFQNRPNIATLPPSGQYDSLWNYLHQGSDVALSQIGRALRSNRSSVWVVHISWLPLHLHCQMYYVTLSKSHNLSLFLWIRETTKFLWNFFHVQHYETLQHEDLRSDGTVVGCSSNLWVTHSESVVLLITWFTSSVKNCIASILQQSGL